MYLIDEYLESHPFIIDTAINDALQGRAICESDAIQKGPEECKKAVLPEAKPHDYNYFREEFSKAINGTKVRNPYIPIATPWLNGPTSRFLFSVDPAKYDTELHINVKRRKIKFNFNN